VVSAVEENCVGKSQVKGEQQEQDLQATLAPVHEVSIEHVGIGR